MPKFIGQTIAGATRLANDMPVSEPDRLRLTYAQAKLLPPEVVSYSLDTTDKGGPRSLAKRWNRWFASAESILTSPRSTPTMRSMALSASKVHFATIATYVGGDKTGDPVPLKLWAIIGVTPTSGRSIYAGRSDHQPVTIEDIRRQFNDEVAEQVSVALDSLEQTGAPDPRFL